MIFATGNKGKAREFQEILGNTVGEIQTMKEAGINIDIVEDGKTFEGTLEMLSLSTFISLLDE